jgi:hypothetical protein
MMFILSMRWNVRSVDSLVRALRPPRAAGGGYEDHPLSIRFGVTVSAPHMQAIVLELMGPHLGEGAVAFEFCPIASAESFVSINLQLNIFPSQVS